MLGGELELGRDVVRAARAAPQIHRRLQQQAADRIGRDAERVRLREEASTCFLTIARSSPMLVAPYDAPRASPARGPASLIEIKHAGYCGVLASRPRTVSR